MTKKQKIWLWIFLGMFILPELLWSPMGNSIYSIVTDEPFRTNSMMNPDNRSILFYIVLLQLIGITASLTSLLKEKKYKLLNGGRIIIFILSTITLVTFFIVYIILATKDISL